MDTFGLSFMPGEQGANDPNGQQATPVQQAIQTLSLRIPRTVGAASPVPYELLTAPGGSALGGNPNSAAILEQIKRMLFGGGANFGTPGSLTSPGSPIPRAPLPPVGVPGGPIPGGGVPMPPPPPPGGGPRPNINLGDPTEGEATPPPPPAPTGGRPLGPGLFERGPRQKQV